MTQPQVISVPDTLVTALRSAVGDTDKSDTQLAEILATTMNDDNTFNLNRAAVTIWTAKAASYASLVDVTESGSSRKMSDLHKNALAMTKHYASLLESEIAVVTEVVAARPRTRRIVRRE